jgi:hypothetical protein
MNVPTGGNNGESAYIRLAAMRRSGGLGPRRWASLAASIAAGVLAGTLLWHDGSRNSLARDVLEHLEQEPEALASTTPQASAAAVDEVLGRSRVRLGREAGPVSYAKTCRIRGHDVAHLVVRTAGGPVTVLLLADDVTTAPVSFAGRGFSGRIVPSGPGSLAVVGSAGADLDEATARLLAAVEWL